MKQITTPSTYEVITDRARYAVALEHLTNTNAGTPRFKATLIMLDIFGEKRPERTFYATAWTFKGHYLNDEGEAKEAVRQYEEILKGKGIY